MQQQITGATYRVEMKNIYATTTTTTTLLMAPQQLLFIPTTIPAYLPTQIYIMKNTKHTHKKI